MKEHLYISKNSFLRFPPKNLLPRTVLDFATITYFTDISNIRYESLIKKLVDFSNNPESNNFNFPAIYSDVWEIISSVSTLRNLILKRFEFEDKHPHLLEFNKAKLLRNTNQHLEDRIIEILEKEDASLFGTLSWTRNLPNTNKIQSFMLYSGVFTKNLNEISGTMPPVPNISSIARIEEIFFETLITHNRKDFEPLKLSIVKLMEDLKIIVDSFEIQIEKQLKVESINGRHNTNLFTQMNLSRVE
jgi:hypothetical protein